MCIDCILCIIVSLLGLTLLINMIYIHKAPYKNVRREIVSRAVPVPVHCFSITFISFLTNQGTETKLFLEIVKQCYENC